MAGSEQVKLQVHHVRFFEYQPAAISCIAHDDSSPRIAVSRSNSTIEILHSKENWMQEMVIAGFRGAAVESLLWAKGRLFASVNGSVTEIDLTTRLVKNSVSSNSGPVWCLTKNSARDQIAAGTEDGCVALYDVSEELRFLTGFGKQEDKILSLAWYSREGANVIVTGGINNIRQWSVKSGQPISRMTLGRKCQKDTVVWCIAVTQDFTIISGDSRGVVTFWNGKESTQLKTFYCHKADVLALCLSQDESQVFTGGVEGAVYQFTLHAADPTSERKRWVHQLLHSRHTHDIKALSYVNGYLVSGGVDTLMYVAKLKGGRSVLELSPVPRPYLIHLTSQNLMLLQYDDFIEVWRLGTAELPTDETLGVLALQHNRVKLLKLKARIGHNILSSAMSCQNLIAFSDTKGIRLFQLHLKMESSNTPAVSVNLVDRRLTHPAHYLTFTPDGRILVAVLTSGSVHLMDTTVTKASCVLPNIISSQVHRLNTSPDSKHLALATLDHGVHIYDVRSGQHLCSCPVLGSQVSALTFNPDSSLLAIAYCNHSVYEFDVEKKEFSKWCRENSGNFVRNWMKPLKHIINISYCPDSPHKILFHTDTALCVLDKSKSLTRSEHKPHYQATTQTYSCARTCYKYKYLLYAGFTSNGMLVAVERPPPDIEEKLPPSLKQKKFGIA